MRNSRCCPKCKHNHILFLTQVADKVGEMGTRLDDGLEEGVRTGASYPWRIGRVPSGDKSWHSIDEGTAGLVQAYICKKCGYTELYTRDPQSIPVDGTIVQELVGPEVRGVYR